jgi:hypothetical protein
MAKRGRPNGYKVSDDTKKKIGEARRKIELAKRRARKAEPALACAACGETKPKVTTHVWNPDETDPKLLDTSPLCGWCLGNVSLVGRRGLGL